VNFSSFFVLRIWLNGIDILTMRDIPMGEEEGPEGSGRKTFKIETQYVNGKE
jgi:hypothetical protein